MSAGRKVALVSSGAVGAAWPAWLETRPADLAQLQAVAAVGQSHLIEAYDRALRAHGRHAAQVLLTADDLDDRTALSQRPQHAPGAVRIRRRADHQRERHGQRRELKTTFGDNDRLAAMVTNLIRAPLLVLLSDVDGLYDGDPRDAGLEADSHRHAARRVDLRPGPRQTHRA